MVASLVLALGWALWHLPLFLYRPNYTSMDAAGAAGWFFSLLTGSVLLTWLYNESRGSILVVALFHAAVDVAFTSGISSPPVITAAGALITVSGIVVLIVAGPRCLSKHGKMIRLLDGAAVTGFIRPTARFHRMTRSERHDRHAAYGDQAQNGSAPLRELTR